MDVVLHAAAPLLVSCFIVTKAVDGTALSRSLFGNNTRLLVFDKFIPFVWSCF